MKCFYIKYEYNIEKNDIENISLCLKQNSCFKVLNTYFIYNKLYGWGTFQLEAYVFNNNKNDAIEELKKSCAVLSFLFRIDIVPSEHYFYCRDDVHFDSLYSNQTIGNRKIDYISDFTNRILALTDTKKECFFKCIECYQSALAFEGASFAEEQFLVLFRIFESIISHFYSGVKKDKLKHDIPENFKSQLNVIIQENLMVNIGDDDLAEITNKVVRLIRNKAKYNILYILSYYNIDFSYDDVLKIVSKRNQITHMDGELFKSDYDNNLQEYIKVEYQLCRELIITYFFEQISYDKKLYCKIEW